jgi:hypothetical protein
LSVRNALILAGAALAAVPAPAAAAAPRVETMVVARSGAAYGPRAVNADVAHLNRCTVPVGTPLAALAWLHRAGGPSFRVSGECSALYVFQVGGDRARGRAGWVYKVGHRLGTTAAADPSGPFGTGRRLRGGQRVVWFWCVAAGRCQRTLELVRPPRRVRAGAAVRITVRAYDDNGRAAPARGVRVALGLSRATTGADGTAVLAAPSHGRVTLRAARRGLVPAFPARVAVA